jgi:hypothetical protein
MVFDVDILTFLVWQLFRLLFPKRGQIFAQLPSSVAILYVYQFRVDA